jgi:hypothetical protein
MTSRISRIGLQSLLSLALSFVASPVFSQATLDADGAAQVLRFAARHLSDLRSVSIVAPHQVIHWSSHPGR